MDRSPYRTKVTVAKVGVDRFLLPVLFLFLSILYGWKLDDIPFHPDEATLIYTSREFETLLTDPLSLAWEPGQSLSELDQYRLLDEPLSRLVFGLARRLAGIELYELNTDWDWSNSWEGNNSEGALPEPRLLTSVRAVSTIFSLGAAFLLAHAMRRISGLRAAIVTLVVFSLNSLILLHGRRAMREGLMLFGTALMVWSLTTMKQKPWVGGLLAAIAVCSRYLLAPLVPIALFATILEPIQKKDLRRAGQRGLQFFSVFIGLFFLLQPVLWKHPSQGLIKMLDARLTFTGQVNATTRAINPESLVDTWQKKIAVLFYQSFISPPAYYEIGNYVPDQAAAFAAYDRNLLVQLWRGAAGGGIFLFLALSGAVLSIYRAIRIPAYPRRFVFLLGLATVLEMGFILLTISLPFQRYYLPLLPFFAAWAGIGFGNRNRLPGPQDSRSERSGCELLAIFKPPSGDYPHQADQD